MQDLNDMVEAFRQLRERCDGAMLATLAEQQCPEASYAPLVWLDGDCFVFLSELATHTHNLRQGEGLQIAPEAAASRRVGARHGPLSARPGARARDWRERARGVTPANARRCRRTLHDLVVQTEGLQWDP